MGKSNRYILILIFFQLLVTIVPSVYGQADSGNASIPIWSEQIGDRKTTVSCSGDGRYMLAGSDTGVLRMYDQCGSLLWEYRQPGKTVRSLAISDNGDFSGAVFVNEEGPSSYADGEVLFFNTTGNLLWKYSEDPTIERIVLSDNGSRIYATGLRSLYLFSQDGTRVIKNSTAGRSWALDSARDGSYAVAGSKISGNRLDEMNTDGTLTWNFSSRIGFGTVDISPDGAYIAAAGYSHLYLLDRNGTLLWQYTGSSDFTSVATSPNAEYTVAGSQYYALFFNRTGSLIWKHEFEDFVNDVGISDDGNRIMAGSSRGVFVFDQDGKILWYYGTPRGVIDISSERNGDFFAAGTTDMVYVFNRWGNTSCDNEVPVATGSNQIITMATDSTGEEQQGALFYFENVSRIVSTGNNNSAFFGIPSKITRFDVVEINESSVRSLHQQILEGNKIPVRFRGNSNILVMEKSPRNPDPEDGRLLYRGNLETIPEHGNKEYFMTLSFYNNTLTGLMSETDGPSTGIFPIINASPGMQLYYVYSTADEKLPGARLDNDVWVMLPSGESKNRNELSSEEQAWFINEQLKRENLSANESDKTPVTETPLSLGIILLAVGIGAAGLRLKKSG